LFTLVNWYIILVLPICKSTVHIDLESKTQLNCSTWPNFLLDWQANDFKSTVSVLTLSKQKTKI